MKPLALIFSSFVFLCLLGCNKESEKKFKPADVATPSATTNGKPEALPYYLRYQIYREDFNSLYGKYLKNGKNEGC